MDHFISQVLLRNFQIPGKTEPTVVVYTRNGTPSEIPIRELFAGEDYFSDHDRSLDKKRHQPVETEAGQVFKRLRERPKSPLTRKDQKRLIRFCLQLTTRVPTIAALQEADPAIQERRHEIAEHWAIPVSQPTGRPGEPSKGGIALAARTEMPKHEQFLCSLPARILTISEPHYFVTGDLPLIYKILDEPFLWFPLSPHQALYCATNMPMNIPDEAIAREPNESMIRHCTQVVADRVDPVLEQKMRESKLHGT